MMRERSRANFVSPEKTSQRHRVPVSAYLPQNSNPSRLGEGTRDFSKLLICQLLIILCQNKALTLCDGQQFSGLLDYSRWHASSSLSLLRQLGSSRISRTAQRVCLVPLASILDRIFWNSFSATKHRIPKRSIRTMRVAFETRGPVDEPYLKLNEEQLLGMTLRSGSMEIGSRRSALQRITFDAGLIGLCPPQSEYRIGTCDMTHMTMAISDGALTAAADAAGRRIELRLERELVDPRLRALAMAVDVERTA